MHGWKNRTLALRLYAGCKYSPRPNTEGRAPVEKVTDAEMKSLCDDPLEAVWVAQALCLCHPKRPKPTGHEAVGG
jgi:hypothetical protein